MTIHILLISGSTRQLSTNTAALRTAQLVAPDSVTTQRYAGLAELPAFNPDDELTDPLPPAVVQLRQGIADADAVLLCTPEYAGALPGSLKNLLDWTVGGGQFSGKPVAWLRVAQPGRGDGAHAELATVLHYVGATVLASACRSVPVGRDVVDAEGVVTDPAVRAAIAETLAAIATAVGPDGVSEPDPAR